MSYLHFYTRHSQSSKYPGKPCGDHWVEWRSPESTTILLADGIGSGIKAHIAAQTTLARLKRLLQAGFSLRDSFSRLITTMQKAVAENLPFSAITAVRILNNGQATILNFENPTPLLINRNKASLLHFRSVTLNENVLQEATAWLDEDDALFIMSDGVVQAGMGRGLPAGWGSPNVAEWMEMQIRMGQKKADLPRLLRQQAKLKWGKTTGDDITVLGIFCRKGKVVNILTGPPVEREKDPEVVSRFLNADGVKVICGATTAKMAAREMDAELEMSRDSADGISPPRYHLEGINLVTEGAVTLTQLYNIIDWPPERLLSDNPVTDLYCLLDVADRVNFWVGTARNPANDSVYFQQQGIISRDKIVPLLEEKLRGQGKLVTVQWV
ncbi:MAG: SpoIIE family protein phosphatase [Calditrichia bacterium]